MSRALGLAAAAITGVQVGVAMVATRALDGAVPPMTLAALRYVVGVSMLLPFFLHLAPGPLARGDRLPVLALGIVQFGVLVALLNAGLERVGAGQGAVLFAIFPLLTMGLGAWIGTERLDTLRIIGAVLSIIGIALCLGAASAPASLAGAALVLAAALCGAVCSVFYRPYLQRYPTLQIGFVAMLAAVAALSLGALSEAPLTVLRALPPQGWGLIVFIGLSSGAGYVLWLTALKHAAAGEATVLLGLSPIAASLCGWAVLGEPLTGGFVLGLGLALGGGDAGGGAPGQGRLIACILARQEACNQTGARIHDAPMPP